jgi:hypothetical protein
MGSYYNGFTLQNKGYSDNNAWYGNMVLHVGQYGALGGGARGDGQCPHQRCEMGTNWIVKNNVLYDTSVVGYGSIVNLTFNNNTVKNSNSGIQFLRGRSGNAEEGDPNTPISGTFNNNIMMNFADNIYGHGANGWGMYGFRIEDPEFNNVSATLNNNITFNTPGGNIFGAGVTSTNLFNQDPGLGTCLVYTPAGSFAAQRGAGANILFRYQNGVLTNVPLWDPVTSQFPCGQTVPGVNDTAGNSCINVHQRLHVNTNGCTLPNTIPPVTIPAPTGLHIAP